jgi:hypothetical protein
MLAFSGKCLLTILGYAYRKGQRFTSAVHPSQLSQHHTARISASDSVVVRVLFRPSLRHSFSYYGFSEGNTSKGKVCCLVLLLHLPVGSSLPRIYSRQCEHNFYTDLSFRLTFTNLFGINLQTSKGL